MRKLGILAAAVAALSALAFGQVLKGSRVLLNGKPFATAQFLNGQWVVPLQDLAKAAGGTVTLEPYFQLRGNTLVAVSQADLAKAKIRFTSTTKDKTDVYYKPGPGTLFHVQTGGVISSRVFMANGQTWVPLGDVARAFGAAFNPPVVRAGDDRPTESISLNFTKIEHASLAMNP